MATVPYPKFELAGQPCKSQNCNGVFVLCMNIKSKEHYYRCTICHSQELQEVINACEREDQ